ncbi:MAG: hypothetical protein ACPLXC_00595 [Candidatus Pacearchaeota archaeon]
MGIGKSLITVGLIGLISEVSAQTIRQRVWDAHNGTSSNGTIVNCWVNNGSSGVQKDTVGIYGTWWVSAANFVPPPNAGDTIKSVDTLDYGGAIYTGRMRAIYDNANLTIPTGFLDDPNKSIIALSVGANKVKNRSSRSQYTMNAKGWLQKNPNQKIQFINYFRRALGQDSLAIDTTDIHNQLYFNLEKQDSIWQQGENLVAQVYQIKGDTTWFQKFLLPIDTTKYGRASIVDSLRYTGDSLVIGVVEENGLENIARDARLIKGPSIVRGGSDIVLNCEGDYYLCNSCGSVVSKGKGNKINTCGLTNGAYFVFIKPKDGKKLLKPEKIVKIE